MYTVHDSNSEEIICEHIEIAIKNDFVDNSIVFCLFSFSSRLMIALKPKVCFFLCFVFISKSDEKKEHSRYIIGNIKR